jgi:excisionase family DNA binding protein
MPTKPADFAGGPPARLAYSLPQTAEALGVSISTIERAVRAGDLPSFTLGRRRLIPADALAAWVRSRAAQGAADD